MSRLRESLSPFDIALQQAPDARPEFRRAARTADRAALALDQEYAQLRQHQISGELLIDHDHGHVIRQRRQLPRPGAAARPLGSVTMPAPE
jgi:hypothetical protein